MEYEKKVMRAYHIELGGALVLYSVLLFASINYGRPMAPGLLRTVVLASPMLGFLVAGWAIARHVGRIDEFFRKTTLENIVIAAGITAAATFTYGFLETAGYPRLSMFTVWPMMGAAWFVITGVRRMVQR